jgi:hypothetical protein
MSAPASDTDGPFLHWPAVFGGAVAASAIALTILAFGSAIGLSVASAAPSWRDSSPWLWMISGFFLLFTALSAFGFGGYIAGRMRAQSIPPGATEREFQDGMHGILTWALAVLMIAVLTTAGALALSRSVAPASASQSGGEVLIANELDELFRLSGARDGDPAYDRAEAARILLKTSTTRGVPPEDRAYLVELVADRTGLSLDDAATRTNTTIARADEALYRARSAAVLQAFILAASLLVGAAVAWFAAGEGGRDRDRRAGPVWDWSLRRKSFVSPPI